CHPCIFFFQAEDGIRDFHVTGVKTCALPISLAEKNAVQKQISYTEIRSPFSGVVDRIPLKEGSLVTPSSLLTTLSDLHTVYAYRSEERRVGKEGRARWWTCDEERRNRRRCGV